MEALPTSPESANGHRPADLLVVENDGECEEAVALLEDLQVIFNVITVSPKDYLEPRDVPKLLTESGIYLGLDSIRTIAQLELVPNQNGHRQR
jgi:hypothetical protein